MGVVRATLLVRSNSIDTTEEDGPSEEKHVVQSLLYCGLFKNIRNSLVLVIMKPQKMKTSKKQDKEKQHKGILDGCHSVYQRTEYIILKLII